RSAADAGTTRASEARVLSVRRKVRSVRTTRPVAAASVRVLRSRSFLRPNADVEQPFPNTPLRREVAGDGRCCECGGCKQCETDGGAAQQDLTHTEQRAVDEDTAQQGAEEIAAR